ncbi:MAG: hypothetical protein R3Y13_02420 [bacterium]
MKKILKNIVIFLTLFTFINVNDIYASSNFYTCTYKSVKIEKQFTENFGSLTGNQYLDLEITLSKIDSTYFKVKAIGSYNASLQPYADIVNNTTFANNTYTYDSSDQDYKLTINYFPVGDVGECGKISSDFTKGAGVYSDVIMWQLGDCYKTGTGFWCSGDYSGTYADVDSSDDSNQLSDDVYLDCGTIDIKGERPYYIVRENNSYYYKFYGINTKLPLTSNNHSCLSSASFRYCSASEASNNKVAMPEAIIYSKDSCTDYYWQTLDYMKSGYSYVNDSGLVYDFDERTGSVDGILGDPDDPNDTAYYLQLALNIIRYVAIVALIILTITGYVSAVASSDTDAVKRQNSMFVKRIIYVIILFLFPVLLEYIFKLTGIYSSTDPLQGIK